MAKAVVGNMTKNDLELGNLSKLQLRVIRDPYGLVNWGPQEFEEEMNDEFLTETGKRIEPLGTLDHFRMVAEHAALEKGDFKTA